MGRGRGQRQQDASVDAVSVKTTRVCPGMAQVDTSVI